MQENTVPMKSAHHFKNIIGQDRAKTRLIESVESARNGGDMVSPLLIAEAGVGKTALLQASCNALAEIGVNCLYFNSPEEFRDKGSEYFQIIDAIQSGKPMALFLDEAHLINFKATRQTDVIRAFIMKAMDGNNQGKIVQLMEDLSFVPNRKNIAIFLATNFADKLDKSGALQSRFDKIELDLYSEEELIAILQIMLEKNGFRHADENTLKMIARCGRGTARPMEKIIGAMRVTRNATDPTRTTINRADVLNALKTVQYFPRGLNQSEIDIMKHASKRKMSNAAILAALPKIEIPALRKHIAYLTSITEFAVTAKDGLAITPKGMAYLKTIQSEGFKI